MLKTDENRLSAFGGCQLYHTSGRSACYCNSIKEAPLVAVIIKKIQQRYTSKAALARLRKTLEKEQEQNRPRPRDLSRLKREIEKLDAKIDQGADRVLDAPTEIVPTLYRKIEELKAKRDRLKAEMDALARYETRSSTQNDKEIDRALDALRTLGESLAKARPAETKDLHTSIVSRIELQFDHAKAKNGGTASKFREGTIYLRPDLADGWPSESTHNVERKPVDTWDPE